MENLKQANLVIVILVISVVFNDVTGTPYRRGGTLFTANDDVVLLDGTEFRRLESRERAWFVTFYASWCGHCQRFAPKLTELASRMRDYNDRVKIGAVACNLATNTDTCSKYNVSNYPTIMFFSADKEDKNRNYYDGTHEVAVMQDFIFDKIGVSKPPAATNGTHSMVDGLATSSARPVNDTWSDKSNQVHFRVTHNTTHYDFNGTLVLTIEEFNAMQEESGITDSNDFIDWFIVQRWAPPVEHNPWVVDGSSMPETLHGVKDLAYLEDLESTVRYSLWMEVGILQEIGNLQLQVLYNYTKLIEEFLPISLPSRNFLHSVNRVMQEQLRLGGYLTRDQWLRLLETSTTHRAFIPEAISWVGCKSTDTRHRGYSCGLWQVFHALTVAYYEATLRDGKPTGYCTDLPTGNSSQTRPIDVLFTIRAYITELFGCRACATHFAQLVPLPDGELSSEDLVLWWWKAHNTVNHHTSTNDHPKLPFPWRNNCQKCQKVKEEITMFDEEHVLDYLQQVYSKDKIIKGRTEYGSVCRTERTAWSNCSVSCGTGTSYRFSNERNNVCKLEMETRLCFMAPCESDEEHCYTWEESKRVTFNAGSCITEEPISIKHCSPCDQKLCEVKDDNFRQVKATCVGMNEPVWVNVQKRTFV